MNTLAIALVVLSALFHALRNLFTKESGDKQIFLWWYSLFGLVFYAPLFLFYLSKQGLPEPASFGWIALSGFAHFLYWIFLTESYRDGDLSHVYPIMRSSPAIVLLFAVPILGEKVSAQGATGILLVAFGVYIINMKRFTPSEFLAPIRAIKHHRATQFAFLTLFSVAAYSLVDKVAVDRIHPVLFAFLHLFFGMIYYTFYIFVTKEKSNVKKEWAASRKTIIANGFLGIFGYSFILMAFTMERVSYIVGLRQLSILFAVLMGGHFLKEKHQTIRLTGACIIFIGAFLISTAE
jgi:uncharacterized membrane protein